MKRIRLFHSHGPYTVVDSGAGRKPDGNVYTEILDSETLPVPTGLDASLLLKYPDSVFFLYSRRESVHRSAQQ